MVKLVPQMPGGNERSKRARHPTRDRLHSLVRPAPTLDCLARAWRSLRHHRHGRRRTPSAAHERHGGQRILLLACERGAVMPLLSATRAVRRTCEAVQDQHRRRDARGVHAESARRVRRSISKPFAWTAIRWAFQAKRVPSLPGRVSLRHHASITTRSIAQASGPSAGRVQRRSAGLHRGGCARAASATQHVVEVDPWQNIRIDCSCSDFASQRRFVGGQKRAMIN